MRMKTLLAVALSLTLSLCARAADVGLNLNWPTNAEPTRIFADLAKLAEVHDAGEGRVDWKFVADAGSAASDGDYTLTVKGKGVTARDDGCWAAVFNPDKPGEFNAFVAGRYDPASDTSTWTVRCPKGPEYASNGITVRFSRPVDDVHLWAPGVDPKNPPLLNPQFRAYLSRFQRPPPARFVLRTMDLQHSNAAAIKTLADVPLPTDATWSSKRGVPPAVIPQIARETGCLVYAHVPACADAAAMRYHVREMVKPLAADGRTWLEVSNEAWNSGPMPAWRVTAAHARGLGYKPTTYYRDADGNLTIPDDGESIRPYLADQYVALHKMLLEEGVRDRVTVCFSVILANPDYDVVMWRELQAAAARGGVDPVKVVDLWVGSPYWEVPIEDPANGNLENDPDLSLDTILAGAARVPDFSPVGGQLNQNLWDRVDQLAARAAARGHGWGVYEYGPNLNGIDGNRWAQNSPEYNKLLATKAAAHDSQLFGDVNLGVSRKLVRKGAAVVLYYKAPTRYAGFESLMGIAPDLDTWTPLCESLRAFHAEQPAPVRPPPPPSDPPPVVIPPEVAAKVKAVDNFVAALAAQDAAEANADAVRSAAEQDVRRAKDAVADAVERLKASTRPSN